MDKEEYMKNLWIKYNKSKNIKIRNLVTGGAGFLGSHLIDKLMNLNQSLIAVMLLQ